jgi:TrmH family RNA methyltransferase
MSRIQTITSPANPLVRDLRRAVSHGERTPDGLCIAEGFHLLDEAIRSGCEVPTILTSGTQSGKLSHELPGARIVILPDKLFQSIASTETTQGVIALVRPREWPTDELFRGTSLVVVLDGIQDPGNAGTIVRAAEAFGATGIVFLKGSASPHHPKTLRAAAGSLFRIPFVTGLDAGAVRTKLLHYRVAIYAAMPYTGAQKLAGATDFVRSCAIVAGSEGRGVSKELRGIAEEVAIPTIGVESLNAAVAASVLLYEACRQRGEAKRQAARQ